LAHEALCLPPMRLGVRRHADTPSVRMFRSRKLVSS
jgi:hypothetical protein